MTKEDQVRAAAWLALNFLRAKVRHQFEREQVIEVLEAALEKEKPKPPPVPVRRQL